MDALARTSGFGQNVAVKKPLTSNSGSGQPCARVSFRMRRIPVPAFSYEVDAVEQISDQRVPSHALAAKIGKGQASRQTARTYHFHTVGVDLDEDVGPFHKPVAVHDGVRDRLS